MGAKEPVAPHRDRESGDRAHCRQGMAQELRIGDIGIGLIEPQRGDGQRVDQCRAERHHRVKPLAKQELKPQPPWQGAQVARCMGQQQRHKAARPLEFLRHHIGKAARPVADGDRLHRMHAPPAARVQDHRGGMILGQFRAKPADRLQCLGAHRVMRADAHRRKAAGIAQLENTVKGGLWL
jgi:hypothetical protein